MTTVNPQTIAITVAALYTFSKYVMLTKSFATKYAVAVTTGRVTNLRPFIWALLPTTLVAYISIASVYDLPCKANVDSSTVAAWIIMTFLPLGISRVSVLIAAFASISAGVALWATATQSNCLFLAISAMLTGAVTLIAYAKVSNLLGLSFAVAFTGPRRAIKWIKSAIEQYR